MKAQLERATARHVEALIMLGWRWEGRGLAPVQDAGYLRRVDSAMLSAELINHPQRYAGGGNV